jgi:hypothetical protein
MAFVLDFKAIVFDFVIEVKPAMICFNNFAVLFFMLLIVAIRK